VKSGGIHKFLSTNPKFNSKHRVKPQTPQSG